jgi:hypothetical protein
LTGYAADLAAAWTAARRQGQYQSAHHDNGHDEAAPLPWPPSLYRLAPTGLPRPRPADGPYGALLYHMLQSRAAAMLAALLTSRQPVPLPGAPGVHEAADAGAGRIRGAAIEVANAMRVQPRSSDVIAARAAARSFLFHPHTAAFYPPPSGGSPSVSQSPDEALAPAAASSEDSLRDEHGRFFYYALPAVPPPQLSPASAVEAAVPTAEVRTTVASGRTAEHGSIHYGVHGGVRFAPGAGVNAERTRLRTSFAVGVLGDAAMTCGVHMIHLEAPQCDYCGVGIVAGDAACSFGGFPASALWLPEGELAGPLGAALAPPAPPLQQRRPHGNATPQPAQPQKMYATATPVVVASEVPAVRSMQRDPIRAAATGASDLDGGDAWWWMQLPNGSNDGSAVVAPTAGSVASPGAAITFLPTAIEPPPQWAPAPNAAAPQSPYDYFAQQQAVPATSVASAYSTTAPVPPAASTPAAATGAGGGGPVPRPLLELIRRSGLAERDANFLSAAPTTGDLFTRAATLARGNGGVGAGAAARGRRPGGGDGAGLGGGEWNARGGPGDTGGAPQPNVVGLTNVSNVGTAPNQYEDPLRTFLNTLWQSVTGGPPTPNPFGLPASNDAATTGGGGRRNNPAQQQPLPPQFPQQQQPQQQQRQQNPTDGTTTGGGGHNPAGSGGSAASSTAQPFLHGRRAPAFAIPSGGSHSLALDTEFHRSPFHCIYYAPGIFYSNLPHNRRDDHLTPFQPGSLLQLRLDMDRGVLEFFVDGRAVRVVSVAGVVRARFAVVLRMETTVRVLTDAQAAALLAKIKGRPVPSTSQATAMTTAASARGGGSVLPFIDTAGPRAVVGEAGTRRPRE